MFFDILNLVYEPACWDITFQVAKMEAIEWVKLQVWAGS